MSTHKSSISLKWKKNKLYDGNIKNTGYGVEFDQGAMWKVVYPDGSRSADYYNLTWAKENAQREYIREHAADEQRGTLDALKSEMAPRVPLTNKRISEA